MSEGGRRAPRARAHGLHEVRRETRRIGPAANHDGKRGRLLSLPSLLLRPMMVGVPVGKAWAFGDSLWVNEPPSTLYFPDDGRASPHVRCRTYVARIASTWCSCTVIEGTVLAAAPNLSLCLGSCAASSGFTVSRSRKTPFRI